MSPVKLFCPQFQHTKSAPTLNDIWQTILAKNSTYKIIEQAKNDFLKDGTWLGEPALKWVCQKIKESPLKIYTFVRLRHIILADQDGTPYAIYHDGKIGKGAVGCIKLAQNLITKELCVVKTMLDDEEKALDESEILKKLNLFNGIRFRTTKDGSHKSYLFMKLLPGITLHQFKKHCKNDLNVLSPQYQAQILHSLLEAIQFLIKNQINHADVSSRNILIDPLTLQAHFIDFGDACTLTLYLA
ncbi:protein kinase domain-containing protein [Candidatus Berkiella aquae]|uniref:Protein kinase n=1 Tax=Candidatus Berkiella aquae TaxID=295108 RepID=A0A0Q9YMJ6_9GAMM|nr:protein kinase [Candidatus Berkiella aquae]MCS5709919.1 protein kinase [Candidatus Berkiella aquae]